MTQPRRRVSHQGCTALLDALAIAIERVQARKDGPWTGEAIEAAQRLAGALRAVQAVAPRPAGSKRGRKPVYDREFAEGWLIDCLARDPDGLPEKQTTLIERLRTAFEIAGKPMPSHGWAKIFVSDLYRRSRIVEDQARSDFAASSALQASFGSAEEFIRLRRLKQNLSEKWCRSRVLQERHESPSAYIAAIMDDARQIG